MSFVRRFFKYSSVAAIGSYSVYVLDQQNWDVKNIGLVRFGRAAYAVGSIAVDYKFSVSKLKDDSKETLDKWSQCHTRSAKRLLGLCCANGGAFIKVGQHIAALDYLVPKEYVEVLSVLHNRGPRTKFEDIKSVIKSELKKDIDELFVEFEEEPVGAASLAQVHKARLRETGEVVAVKVQHPNVFRHSLVDIATMEVLFGAVSRLFPDFSFMWLANETRINLPMELDFINEGKNSETMHTILKDLPWFKIPKIYWKYSTKRVLMMEFVTGGYISDQEYIDKNKINRTELAARLETIYSEMIFKSGTVHCDPHPGNILVRKTDDNDFDVILLDHGLYTKLTDDFRQDYSSMWFALLRGDIKEIERAACNMGIEKKLARMLGCIISAKPWSAIERGLENRPDEKTRKSENNELRSSVQNYMNEISKVLANVDRQLLLVLKTNDLIRSIGHGMGFDERRSFLTMSKFCIEVVQAWKLKQCNGVFESITVRLQTTWLKFKIHLYTFVLWVDSFFGKKHYL